MPKILPDVQNKILSVAKDQFREYGFEKTDMREIAAEAEIAVGTIYLHYQNKENLYLHVIAHSWKNMEEKIEEISQTNDDPEKQLKEVLTELVQDMIQRKSTNSLWVEIGSMHHHLMSTLPVSNPFTGARDPISRIISLRLKSISVKYQIQIDDLTLSRLGSYAFIMTVDACMQDPATAFDQVELILDLLMTFIRKPEK